jgi:hypothetical protein
MSTIRSWFGGKKQAPAEEMLALPEASPQPIEAGPPPSQAPIDFVAVLAAAGVEPDVRDRVVKAKQLLRSLPPDAPSEMKRQVVEAAFQAFEIPTQKIIEGASAEIQALRSYIQVGEEEKSNRLADGERRIAELEGEIRDARTSMALAVAAQERRKRLTTEEIATVEPIVQFFAQEAIAMAAPIATKPARKPSPTKPEAAAPEDPFAEPEYGIVADEDAGSGFRSKPQDALKADISKRSA